MMGLHIHRLPTGDTLAFLYDPIFADGRQKSYALDWGREQVNEAIERYILKHKGDNGIFHTFTYPVSEVRSSDN